MITEDEVKKLLEDRLVACWESCNRHHITHTWGQVRALTAVLTGTMIDASVRKASDVMDYCGMTYQVDGDDVVIGD